jgi:peptide/nickel transport system ATP-binding protein
MSAVHLEARSVSAEFGSAHKGIYKAVDAVDLTLRSGLCMGIVGQSGSGKSTLARMLAGLTAPTRGAVYFDGEDISAMLENRVQRLRLRRAVQFIGQDTTSSFDPMRTLRDSLRTPAQRLRGMTTAQADAAINELLAELSILPDWADRYPREVSGGQRQRLAIARALIVQPRILICDEIVSALDVSVQGSVLNFLKAYAARTGAGLAFISHGIAATAFIADEMNVMLGGRIIEQGATKEVIANPRHDHTAALVASSRGARRHKPGRAE